jgi:SM-20-related protein
MSPANGARGTNSPTRCSRLGDVLRWIADWLEPGDDAGAKRPSCLDGKQTVTQHDLLDYDALRATPLETKPFSFFVTKGAVKVELLPEVHRDFPKIPGPGSHPPSQLNIHGAFAALMQELEGPRFRSVVEEKFGFSLEGLPTMYTVRGLIRRSDGAIHTDSATKVITVLLYLNEDWASEGGRLRILRSATHLDDFAVEIPPKAGTLLAFRRSNHSWHGHKPFSGPRRAIQMNWVVDEDVVRREQKRHALSSAVKKLTAAFQPWRLLKNEPREK